VNTPPHSAQSKMIAVAIGIACGIVAVAPGASRAILAAEPAQTSIIQADAFVSGSAPRKSYGTLTALKVDRTPRTAYLRFVVGAVTSPVTKATLRVYALKGSASSLAVRAVADNAWNESTLTYASAPAPSMTVSASSGAIANATWVDLDVTPLVSGNGTYSFALTSASRTSISLAARERGSSTAAQLVVQQVAAADTTPPTAPTNLVKAGATATSVDLSWSASSDDVGVSGYRVYRDATLLGSTAQTSYTAGGLSCGTSYTFEVEAFDAANNASPRTAVTGATSACPDAAAPTAPTGLSVVAKSDTSVWISWSASTDNVGVTGYDVYVGSSKVDSSPATSYTFAGLACGIAYTFGVEARDAAGNTSSRATLSATTAACPTGTTHTYYVDSVGGSDAGAGSSPTSAWKTLANVNGGQLVPGDTVLLKRGGVWNGSLKVTASGTSASPITVGSYGSGELPVVGGAGVSTCVVVSGSYVLVRELHADNCSWAGVEISGNQVRLERSLLSRNVVGVDVKAGSVGAAVVDNDIVDNNKMSVLTASPTNDDSGAFGVLLNGDDAEIAFNRISGSDAFSYDYGRDGAAVEVYGGRNNTVHHNQAFENHDFTELGNPRSQDNTFAYNLVRSTLQTSSFLITRGGLTSLGPVLRTHVYNNTVYLTGSSSQGFVCYSGCSADVLTMRNNVIEAVWKVGYADAPFDENNDLFSGGVLQFTKGASSIVANPQFVDPAAQDFHLQAGSAAVDRGVAEGYTFDLDRSAVPKDGNGDGIAMPDGGVFERAAASNQLDTAAPTAPGNLAASGVTASGATLSWSASTDNIAVAGYRVYRDSTLVTSTGATSYSLTGLACGTTYTLGVEAYDAAGNTSSRTSTSATTTSCADTTPPTAPGMLTAIAAAQTSVTLSWIASTDNVGVSGYGLYVNGTLVGSTTTTTYAFGGLSCGTSYTLAVDASDAAGNRSAKSSLTTATSPCTDTTPPTPPGNLQPTGNTATTISVSWSASTDNVAVAGYNVYVNGTKVGTTTNKAYTFSGLACGTTYTLGVEATDTSGLVSGRTGITTATAACASATDHVIAAAGDFTSSSSNGNDIAVRNMTASFSPEVILGLGDFQYDNISSVLSGFDPIWGPKPNGWYPKFRPTAGPTHDVTSCTDALYENYWGRGAMTGYSFDIGNWHIISLPSAAYRFACGTAAVTTWLTNDLNASTAPCTLAFWHEPYWTRPTSEHPTRTSAVKPWVQLLYDHNAELVLAGHQHNYQRFAPQDPNDNVDTARGLREFIVGTGGIGVYGFTGTAPNVEASDATTYGVLKLTLHENGYDAQFLRAAGGTFTDSVSGTCH
jgi:chitodextrinase